VIKKEAEKILEYKDLVTEIQRMWNAKTNVIPVIMGATGTILRITQTILSNRPGEHEIKELQKKNSHIGHCTQTAGSADVKVQNIFHGRNKSTWNTNSKNRTTTTLLSPGQPRP